jgi:HEAT repeat protein
MSDPQADRGENSKVGELLSTALVEHGVSEISTVFMDDLIALELNLPWRVEMAIQRLAKDLKVLPMFQKKSDDVIGKLKLQIIQDILRPLRHPEFLKDLIINCYIIAQHVPSVETEDIEKVIIDAFPLDTLLPTSRFIFDELNRLRELNKENSENPALKRRFAGVKRILKWVSSRLVLADVRGAQSFLEQLYLNKVLVFEDLPADVQYLVNTDKMAKDVQKNVRNYVSRILTAKTSDDATVLLKCFRRVVPVLIEQKDWQIVLWLTKATDKAVNALNVFAASPNRSFNPVRFVFKNRTKELIAGYEDGDKTQRRIIEDIVDRLGPQGIEVLSKILSDSDNRRARKAAMEALIKKGDLARDWALKVLDDPKQKWFLKRNALMLLSYVGRNEDEIGRARKHMAHEHPRVRDEAINALVQLKAKGIEPLVIASLNDPDDKVRWRAMNAIGKISPFSQESIQALLTVIKSDPPEDKEAAAKHYLKVTQLIRAIGVMNGITKVGAVEECILEVTEKATDPKKGLLNRLKKSTDADQSAVLSDGINTLGKIGTAKSEAFLENLAAGKSPHAEAAQKSANDIKLRHIEQLSNASANAATPTSG